MNCYFYTLQDNLASEKCVQAFTLGNLRFVSRQSKNCTSLNPVSGLLSPDLLVLKEEKTLLTLLCLYLGLNCFVKFLFSESFLTRLVCNDL